MLSTIHERSIVKKTSWIVLLVLLIGIINISKNLAGESNSALEVILTFDGVDYSIAAPNTVLVAFTIDLIFHGDAPPSKVILSLPSDKTDVQEMYMDYIDITATFGPWINISDTEWVLGEIQKSKQSLYLPHYEFTIDRNQSWPNEESYIDVFFGHTIETIY